MSRLQIKNLKIKSTNIIFNPNWEKHTNYQLTTHSKSNDLNWGTLSKSLYHKSKLLYLLVRQLQNYLPTECAVHSKLHHRKGTREIDLHCDYIEFHQRPPDVCRPLRFGALLIELVYSAVERSHHKARGRWPHLLLAHVDARVDPHSQPILYANPILAGLPYTERCLVHLNTDTILMCKTR